VAASSARPRPLFPIGGIDATNAAELAPVGRAAVCAAILGVADPGAAARALRLALDDGET
jgi:thiamine monophosphate synthase